jgi:hypothetical protein
MCINKNECPACGQQIMNDAMQELLVELRQALTEMPNDPEGLAGWLLTHYRLVKIGDGKPVMEFFGPNGKKQTRQNQNGARVGNVGSVRDDGDNLLAKFKEQTGGQGLADIQKIVNDELPSENEHYSSLDEENLKYSIANKEETNRIISAMQQMGQTTSKRSLVEAINSESPLSDDEDLAILSSLNIKTKASSGLEAYKKWEEVERMKRGVHDKESMIVRAT